MLLQKPILTVHAWKQFDELRRATDGAGRAGSAYVAMPGRMSNEDLVHELLLDPAFQLDESSLVDDLKLLLRVGYIKQQLELQGAPANHESLLRTLTHCLLHFDVNRPSLLRRKFHDLMIRAENNVFHRIRKAEDFDFVKQQAEAGLYRCDNFKNLIVGIRRAIQRAKQGIDWECEKLLRDAGEGMRPAGRSFSQLCNI